jgi:hypothetical protein
MDVKAYESTAYQSVMMSGMGSPLPGSDTRMTAATVARGPMMKGRFPVTSSCVCVLCRFVYVIM